jgi:hypothetical protein
MARLHSFGAVNPFSMLDNEFYATSFINIAGEPQKPASEGRVKTGH